MESCKIGNKLMPLFSDGFYLLTTKEVQQKWLNSEYKILKNKIDESELISYSMLENNIFGNNERFIDWNSDKNSLIDDFLENYTINKTITVFIKDLLICILEDSKHKEYYELSHNLNLIIKFIDINILTYENEIDEYFNNNKLCDKYF